jgi:hypothetical protein
LKILNLLWVYSEYSYDFLQKGVGTQERNEKEMHQLINFVLRNGKIIWKDNNNIWVMGVKDVDRSALA